MKKYTEISKIFETGIRDIKNILKDYPKKEFELFFHQDLDGVTTALAMKEYLRRYGFKLRDAHIIQYGGMEFAVKNTPVNVLPVLVDFAHSKPMFVIATDHHDSQAGAEQTKATHYKAARSNVETISGEVSPSDIFTPEDIKLISTVDSADYFKHGITPEMVSNAIFELDKAKPGSQNRFIMGLVTNRLLLAYKNKQISVKSLDGKRNHKNRNFLEALVLDSTPSLINIYNNIVHYVKNAKTLNWDKQMREYVVGALAEPEELQKNLGEYQETMKEYENLEVDDEYGIAVQYAGGPLFKPGAYDRYTVFKNFPDINFYSIAWPMGLVQVSCNPFKEKLLDDINLGAIKDEILEKYKGPLSKAYVDILAVKKVGEKEIPKVTRDKEYRYKDQKGVAKGKEEADIIGFKSTDLDAFYKGRIKTVKDGKVVNVDVPQEHKELLDKNLKDITDEEKRVLNQYKISVYDLIVEGSGGHKCITNMQGWGYIDYVRPELKQYLGKVFGLAEDAKTWKDVDPKDPEIRYTNIMRVVQQDFMGVLREKIEEARMKPENIQDRVEASVEDGDGIRENLLTKYSDFKRINESSHQVDGLEIKVGDKLLVKDGGKKSEVVVISECEKVSSGDIDCKVKVKKDGKEETWALHNKDGEWTLDK